MMQLTLPGLQVMLSDLSRKGIGTLGERLAGGLLEQSGYEVSYPKIGERCGDIRAVNRATGEIHRVEVKTARRGSDGQWRFNLRKKGHTDITHADQVILLAALPSGRCVPFVIPVTALADLRQAVISSHPESYSGKLAVYRQAGGIHL